MKSDAAAAPNTPNASGNTDRLDPAIWKISSVAVIGSFLSQLDSTIVNVSLSSLAAVLHTSLSAIQWVTSGYLLALALMLPLNGWLVDRIGAKMLYLWCFAAFTLSSALCGLAWSASSLIGFRVLQGMSGGLLAPMAQMMMARAAGKHMARVLGFAAMPVVLAPVLGPVIAGAILQHASWRWLFLVNLPVGIAALVLAVLFLPSDRGETRRRSLDLAGLALLSPGLVLFLYGSDHLGAPVGLAAFLTSAALLAVFFKMSARKGDKALIDLKLFSGKVFSAAVVTLFLANGILFAAQMLIPIYLIRACGRSPSETGWLLAPAWSWIDVLLSAGRNADQAVRHSPGRGGRSADGSPRHAAAALPGESRAGCPGACLRSFRARLRSGCGRRSVYLGSLCVGAARRPADGDDGPKHCAASRRADADDADGDVLGMETAGRAAPGPAPRTLCCGLSFAVRPARRPVCRRAETAAAYSGEAAIA